MREYIEGTRIVDVGGVVQDMRDREKEGVLGVVREGETERPRGQDGARGAKTLPKCGDWSGEIEVV